MNEGCASRLHNGHINFAKALQVRSYSVALGTIPYFVGLKGHANCNCESYAISVSSKNCRGGRGTVDYLEQFCAISKVPMVLNKESTN